MRQTTIRRRGRKAKRRSGCCHSLASAPELWISGNIPEKRRDEWEGKNIDRRDVTAGDDDFPKASATLLPRQEDPTAAGTRTQPPRISRGGEGAQKIQTRGEKDRAAYRSAYTAQRTATRLCRRTPRSPVLASPRSLPPVAACKATSWTTSIPRGKKHRHTRTQVSS